MLPALHLVTDDRVLSAAAFPMQAARLLEAHGARVALHLRGHGLGGAALHRLAEFLVPLARATGSLLLVNDRVDVALAAGAGGVHVGKASISVPAARRLLGPGPVIGYSAHSAAEVDEAAAGGADFALLGSIFPSRSHAGGDAGGVAVLRSAHGARVPVIAIGGIAPAHVREVVHAGAFGVAALSGVWMAADAVAAAAGYLNALEGGNE